MQKDATSLAGHGQIDQDLACLQCGYNLRTLLPQGRCPECGAAVAPSLIAARTQEIQFGPFALGALIAALALWAEFWGNGFLAWLFDLWTHEQPDLWSLLALALPLLFAVAAPLVVILLLRASAGGKPGRRGLFMCLAIADVALILRTLSLAIGSSRTIVYWLIDLPDPALLETLWKLIDIVITLSQIFLIFAGALYLRRFSIRVGWPRTGALLGASLVACGLLLLLCHALDFAFDPPSWRSGTWEALYGLVRKPTETFAMAAQILLWLCVAVYGWHRWRKDAQRKNRQPAPVPIIEFTSDTPPADFRSA